MKTNLFSLLLLTVLLCAVQPAMATRIVVNNNPDNSYRNYTDLTPALAAIDTAEATKDTIYVVPTSAFYTMPTITKPVTIIGGGSWWSAKKSWINNGFYISRQRVSLIGLYISGQVSVDNTFYIGSLYYYIRDILLQRNYIAASTAINAGSSTRPIQAIQNYIVGEPRLSSNSLFRNNIVKGVINTNSGTNLTIENNVFIDSTILGQSSVGTALASSSTYRNNIFVDATGKYLRCSGSLMERNVFTGAIDSVQAECGINNCSYFGNVTPASYGYKVIQNAAQLFDPAYGNSPDMQYKLLASSAAKTAGYNGVECGVYGGLYPFVPSGYPTIPRITELAVLSSANGVITFKIKAISKP